MGLSLLTRLCRRVAGHRVCTLWKWQISNSLDVEAELLGSHHRPPPGRLVLEAARRALVWVESHQQSVVRNVSCGKLKVVFILGAQVAGRDSTNMLWMCVCVCGVHAHDGSGINGIDSMFIFLQ